MKKAILLIPALFALSACASMGGEAATQQQILVRTTPTQAECTLTNNRGSWSVKSPDTVTVKRDNSDLQVYCAKGTKKASMSVKYMDDESTYKYGAQSGLLGALVDHSTGAAYIYQSKIDLELK